MEYIDVDSIVEGITIAVVAAIILGSYQWYSKCKAQREQEQHIRDIIAEGPEKVRDAMPIGGMSVDAVRFTVFEYILREVNAALDYRIDRLGYRQKYEIQKVTLDVSAFMSALGIGTGEGQNIPGGVKFYEQHFFAKVRAVDWLAEASPEPLRDPDDDHTRDASC